MFLSGRHVTVEYGFRHKVHTFLRMIYVNYAIVIKGVKGLDMNTPMNSMPYGGGLLQHVQNAHCKAA